MKLDYIFAVIVIYKCKVEESSTLYSLNEAVEQPINVLIYDNSPAIDSGYDVNKFANLRIQYVHNPNNPGISKAYNYALNEAKNINKRWLLLLDQDTTLSKEYFQKIVKISDQQLRHSVVSIIPNIKSASDNQIISPLRILPGGFLKPLSVSQGYLNINLAAINSGALINIDFVLSVGGFNEDYKLDMLDYWFNREIYKSKKDVLLLDVNIIHELSVKDYNIYIGIDRYIDLLVSENLYFSTDGRKSYLMYKIRLLLRTFKQIVYFKFKYAKWSLSKFF